MTKTEVVVPFSTLLRIIATAAGVFILIKIFPLLLLLFLAMLIAVTLHPVSRWLEQKGVPHGLAVALIAVFILLALFAAVFFLIPNLVEQLATVVKDAPGWRTEVLGKIPPGYLKNWITKQADHASVSSEHMLAASGWVATGISEFFLVLILAIYLIYDGARAYQWTRAFFSTTNRRKLDDTAREVSSIIVAYVAGQFITSTICGIFVFIVLISLKVPAALLLAALAMIFDILPLLGFFIFTIPAILLAMTTSASAAITVGILYLVYHLIENYFIVPKVYGNRLRLSDLVVLLSVLIGSLVAGIIGAILVLPLVASYPAIERIWLAPYLEKKTIRDHDKEEKEDPK